MRNAYRRLESLTLAFTFVDLLPYENLGPENGEGPFGLFGRCCLAYI